MISGRHADRLWIAAGLVVIVILAVATWFLAVSPQYAEASELRSQTDTSRAQATTLRKRIVDLKKEKAKLPQLTATLQTYQEALPANPGAAAFLRQLQASGTKLGIVVESLTVGNQSSSKASPGVLELALDMTLKGKPGQLTTFLEQLQGGKQKRAVLIESAIWDMSPGDNEDKPYADRTGSLNLQMKAFVAPPLAADAPAVTTD